MINRLGIPINMHEAKVLLACSDKSQTGNLTLEDFMHLIYDEDDKLNIKLSEIPETDEGTENLEQLMSSEHAKNI
jgi:hypothetical protein